MTEEQFIKVTQWQKETFPKASLLSKIKHLQEELAELKDAIIKDLHTQEIEHEFADCFTLLFGSASTFGMDFKDIISCIDSKMEINKKRTWGAPDKDGVVRHIK